MASIEESLKWTTEINYGPTHSGDGWITVEPSQGTGTQDVTITVTPATNHNETDTEATVIFKCDEDCSPPLTATVEVTRCVPDCEYEAQGTTEYTFQTKRVGKCETSAEFDVPYVITYQPTVQGCTARQESGEEHIHETFEVNNTSSERTVKEVSGKYKIIQEAGPCECLNPSVSVKWDDVTLTVEKCDTEKTVKINGVSTTSYTNCESDTAVTSVTMTYTFSKNNTTDQVPHVFYYPEGKPTGYATITINQEAGPCEQTEICIGPKSQVGCKGGTVEFDISEGPCD